MKISFVIPAHNEEKRIGKCLKSIVKEIHSPSTALSATDAVEIIVVDNASTDSTREVALRHPKVTVVDEPFKGLGQARRAGFVVSTGELVANLYADTELPRGWLQKVMTAFEKDERLVGLSGPYVYRGTDIVDKVVAQILYGSRFLFYFCMRSISGEGALVEGGNFIMRRSALLRANNNDSTAAFYGAGADIACRLSKMGEVRWMWSLPVIRVK